MPRYNNSLDDPTSNQLDSGFYAFNNRVRPDQLQDGVLADSQNGRMDLNGQWQTRKGISNKKTPLATGDAALKLPFSMFSTASPKTGLTTPGTVTVSNSDITFSSSGSVPTLKFTTNFSTASGVSVNSTSRSGTTLTINVGASTPANGHGLTVGSIIEISGATVTSGTDPDGFRTVATIVDDNNFTVEVTGLAVNPAGTITYKVFLAELAVGSVLTLSGMDTATVSPNGAVSVTAFTQTTASSGDTSIKFISDFTIEVPSLSGKGSSDATLATPSLNDGVVNQVYGSLLFSDPNSEGDDYIILAANTKAVAVKITSSFATTQDITYGDSQTVSSDVELVQAFNKLFIFRDGTNALEIDLAINNIAADQTANVTAGSFVVGRTYKITATSSGGGAATDFTSIGAADSNVGTIFVATGVGTNTGTATEFLQFTRTTAAAFTQTTTLDTTAFSITSGLATATVSNSLKVGDQIFCSVAGTSTLTAGTPFVVSEIVGSVGSQTGFKFFSGVANVSSADHNVVFSTKVSDDIGFTNMPGPKYGVLHKRRLAVPFNNEITGTNTFASRSALDEIIISDIADTNTFEHLFASFKCNAGASDFNVGMLSFSDDKLLVFNRNSIHLVTLVGSDNLSNSTNVLLTQEVGCMARNTIKQIGSQVLFLSDNGVYALEFFDRYNLRGSEVPLSQSVEKTIQRITKGSEDKATAVYFNNRYYIALPVDGSTVNNIVLIYNFLNKSWESVDSVSNTDFEFTNLIIGGKGDQRGVYVINTDGGIHRLETEDDGKDRLITLIGGSVTESLVPSSIKTKMYNLKSIERKKFTRAEFHLESSKDKSSDVNLEAITENIDKVDSTGQDLNIDLGSASSRLRDIDGNSVNFIPAGEDVSVRTRIGGPRSYGIQFQITGTEGRPKLRAVKVSGAITNRSTSSVQ